MYIFIGVSLKHFPFHYQYYYYYNITLFALPVSFSLLLSFICFVCCSSFQLPWLTASSLYTLCELKKVGWMPLFPPKALKSPTPTIPFYVDGPCCFQSKFQFHSHPKPKSGLVFLSVSRRRHVYACSKGLGIAVPKPVSAWLDSKLRSVGAKHVDVATLGNLCVDIVLNVPHLPPPSLHERKAFMERLASSPPPKVGISIQFIMIWFHPFVLKRFIRREVTWW